MAKSESTDNVVKEFKPVGKYRVRLLEWKEKLVLDVREYVEEETYTGFTKRGIRLSRDEAPRSRTPWRRCSPRRRSRRDREEAMQNLTVEGDLKLKHARITSIKSDLDDHYVELQLVDAKGLIVSAFMHDAEALQCLGADLIEWGKKLESKCLMGYCRVTGCRAKRVKNCYGLCKSHFQNMGSLSVTTFIGRSHVESHA